MKELALFGLLVIAFGFLWLGSLLVVNAKTLTDAYILGTVIGGVVWVVFISAWFVVISEK